ncbi:hypothetical protein ADK65_13750 [Streptomyces sp. NRRL B-1140]|uniref:hypothetical protein n=1 Tax=Streptomyces sp. NRRL B-1140 TaxID=1415549 RepID=UPI0006C18750|nr:hypothetical protein [Streptomyces sp. NRRL B-1140]KOX00694.1 hypothetical protein ADK65_13750 [Streptomyces sp. NRRL B-1140]
MTTRLDGDPGDPEHAPDDPLAVILRPSSPGYLGAPAGQYQAIRRRAARRRLLRGAAGAGLCCVAAALIALPLRHTASEHPPTPTIPMAPPTTRPAPATDSTPPTPVPSPSASRSRPSPPGTGAPRTTEPGTLAPEKATGRREPSRAPSATPTAIRPVPSEARPATDRETVPDNR